MASKVTMLRIEVYDGDKAVGTLIAPAKTFKTGSHGFLGTGKLQLDETTRLQSTVSLVVIGSKPGATVAKKQAKK